MRAYGVDSEREKGHKYVEDDICTKGFFRGGKSNRSKRRNAYKRIYKKLERVNTKRNIKKEFKKDGED